MVYLSEKQQRLLVMLSVENLDGPERVIKTDFGLDMGTDDDSMSMFSGLTDIERSVMRTN
jgi:hypothetical protein